MSDIPEFLCAKFENKVLATIFAVETFFKLEKLFFSPSSQTSGKTALYIFYIVWKVGYSGLEELYNLQLLIFMNRQIDMSNMEAQTDRPTAWLTESWDDGRKY